MHPREYLKVAECCLLSTEPWWVRSSMNRTYYALYSAAEAFLIELGCWIPRDGRGHRLVRLLCKRSGVPELGRVADTLRQLLTWRTLADYRHEDPDPEDIETAAHLLRVARSAFVRLDEAMAPARRAKLPSLMAPSLLVWPVIVAHKELLLERKRDERRPAQQSS